jgi:mannose-6-phosphate isomerase-like protein (cupin superfamily)
VVAGTGIATVEGERIELRKSTLLRIGRGEVHEIRNTGKTPLKTLNIYVPPAYTSAGDELPAGASTKG